MNHNLHLAVAALSYVRACRVLSPNKCLRPDPSMPETQQSAMRQRKQKEWRALELFRVNTLPGENIGTPANSMKFGALALAAKLGNCGELALACSWYLRWQPASPDHSIVCYPDHEFVVLGQPADRDAAFPRKFSKWKSHAVVLDAWADIACPAREYPARWRARMANWDQLHLNINHQSPLSRQWYELVNQHKACLMHLPAAFKS